MVKVERHSCEELPISSKVWTLIAILLGIPGINILVIIGLMKCSKTEEMKTFSKAALVIILGSLILLAFMIVAMLL